MLIRYVRSQAIVFIGLMGFTLSASIGYGASVFDYLNDLSQGKISPPKINKFLPNDKSDNTEKVDQPIRSSALLHQPPLSLLSGTIINQRPVLFVEDANKVVFKIYIDNEIYFQNAAHQLLEETGFVPRNQKLIRDQTLLLGKLSYPDLIKFLEHSIKNSHWKNFINEDLNSPHQSAIQKVEIKLGLIESTLNPEDDDNVQHSLAPLAALWLGCEQSANNTLYPQIQSLRLCLGQKLTTMGPNALPPVWVHDDLLGLPLRDEELQKWVEQRSRQDWDTLIAKLSSLSPRTIEKIFLNSDLPEKYAQIYATKLISRLNSLRSYFGYSLLPNEDLQKINDAPYIENGLVIATDPRLPFDMASSTGEHLFRDAGQMLLSGLDAAAQESLKILPYTPVDISSSEIANIAAGFSLRIHRDISPNPTPTNTKDLYIIRDELELMVTATAGKDKTVPYLRAWASIGPGLIWKFVRISFSQSEQEARKKYWTLPKDFILKQNFLDIKSGEALAYQSGVLWSLGAGVRPRLDTYLVPSALVMGTAETVEAFQVYKADEINYTIAYANDLRQTILSNALWRSPWRYFRIPIFSLHIQNGNQTFKKYEIQAKDTKQQEFISRLLRHRSLDSKLKAQLEKNYPSTTVTSDYFLASYSYFLGFYIGKAASNRTIVNIQNGSETDRFIYTKKYYRESNLNLQHITNYQTDQCASITVELIDETHEASMQFNCHYSAIEKKQELAQVLKWLAAKNPQLGRIEKTKRKAEYDITLTLPPQLMHQLLAQKSDPKLKVTTQKLWENLSHTENYNDQDYSARLYIINQLRNLFNEPVAEKKMKIIADLMARDGLNAYFVKLLSETFSSFSWEVSYNPLSESILSPLNFSQASDMNLSNAKTLNFINSLQKPGERMILSDF